MNGITKTHQYNVKNKKATGTTPRHPIQFLLSQISTTSATKLSRTYPGTERCSVRTERCSFENGKVQAICLCAAVRAMNMIHNLKHPLAIHCLRQVQISHWSDQRSILKKKPMWWQPLGRGYLEIASSPMVRPTGYIFQTNNSRMINSERRNLATNPNNKFRTLRTTFWFFYWSLTCVIWSYLKRWQILKSYWP